MSCSKDCTNCKKCRDKKKPTFGACKPCGQTNRPKFGACAPCGQKPKPKFGACDVHEFVEQPSYINNPYYDYADYYVMMNGRNRRMLHRCNIEDYYRKKVFDGINLAPHVHMNQFYSLLITHLIGVYQDIMRNQIYHPNLNADKSAKLIIKRILKTIVGEFEAIKIMYLWEVSKCRACSDYDYSKYNCPPPKNNPPPGVTSKEWDPTHWDYTRQMNWNWGPQDQYYSRANF